MSQRQGISRVAGMIVLVWCLVTASGGCRRAMTLERAVGEIDSPLPDARREAVAYLAIHPATRGRPEFSERLLELALGVAEGNENLGPDPDVQVRLAALTALELNPVELDEESLARLRKLLVTLDPVEPGARFENLRTTWLRVEAVEALGFWIHDEGAMALATALREDPSPKVRQAAGRALGSQRPREPAVRTAVVEALIEQLPLRDPRPFVIKYECLESLRELTGRADIEYDPQAWRAYFAEAAAAGLDPLANAGSLAVRQVRRLSYGQSVGATINRLLYIVRKPARTEE